MASFYLLKHKNIDCWRGEDTHLAMKDIHVIIGDDENRFYKITLKAGFRCDGLSVPSLFQWFLPSWDKKNFVYNVAGAVHDALYTTGGWYGTFCREQCDDIFRSLLREAGISRFKAGCADKAVEWFAGGPEHWRNDEFKNKNFIVVTKVS